MARKPLRQRYPPSLSSFSTTTSFSTVLVAFYSHYSFLSFDTSVIIVMLYFNVAFCIFVVVFVFVVTVVFFVAVVVAVVCK